MKKALLTVLFYAGCYALLEGIGRLSPSGPCNISTALFLSVVSFSFLPFLLLIRSAYITWHRENKSNWPSTVIHGLVCIGVIIFWLQS